MNIITIIGARPQFIKASAMSRAIREQNEELGSNIKEIIIHTGQHFDKNMSDVFFSELGLPKPDYNLEVSNLSHGAMTGRMLESIEMVLQEQYPDLVLVYGDTNSTLAGSLAARKMHIPVAHVESGLRSFNIKMPEEVNRILSDRISDYLFCPTQKAVDNLRREGIDNGVYNVGDVMFDVTLYYREKAREQIDLSQWGISECNYVLCTIHRAENTNDTMRLASILEALREISTSIQVILPLHPRTKNLIRELNKEVWLDGLMIIDPLPYLEMLRLEMSAKVILTDSGGVQKEAYFNQVPCITMRDETEWVETVDLGWNQIAGADKELILEKFNTLQVPAVRNSAPYGSGRASYKILEVINAHA